MTIGDPIYKEFEVLGKQVQICIGRETRQCDSYYKALEDGDGHAAHMLYEGDCMYTHQQIQRSLDLEYKFAWHKQELERFGNLNYKQQEHEIAYKLGVPVSELRPKRKSFPTFFEWIFGK